MALVRNLQLALLFAAAVISTAGWAGKRTPAMINLQPGWASSNPAELSPNASFLFDHTTYDFVQLDPVLSGATLDPDFRTQADAVFRDYEMRRQYGLANEVVERNFQAQNQDLANRARNAEYLAIRNEGYKRAQRVIKKDPVLKTVQKVVSPAVVVGGIISGNPVPIQVNETTSVLMRTDFTQQNAQVSWSSPLLDGSFLYDQTSPISPDFTVPPPNDPMAHRERYRLSVTKGLPLLGLTSGLTFGSTSSTVTASVSKSLTDHLSCSVLSQHNPLDPTLSDYKSAEEVLRLDYSLRF